jgi:hypothetical protein
MIDFRAADLQRLLAQLQAEGLQVDEKIDDQSHGRFGWITDPEAHRIELWEAPRRDERRYRTSTSAVAVFVFPFASVAVSV